ncbi:MAG: hypothetical protein XD63_1744 [Thermoanaerobacterales bacterium 50_218]|nr:MAG: hypothetical protein XD63_1744 [Thermoanaerobacterales bacterium 50_218]
METVFCVFLPETKIEPVVSQMLLEEGGFYENRCLPR